ncbi:GroES-like protein [Pleomassaria siparia CBS 279.74]|uniref:GroES-like protein n=1 Tax=Pleomassaria siparia CBS 279.74 TaxID=1314801 RepID=A0A6G1KN43_9PLEO|nr:GroES-like protein [Pleomassaria siparia CBS 279.74]
MSNRAAILKSEKVGFEIRDTETGKPGKGEVLVKVHAAAIEPTDAELARYAILYTVMKVKYPTVLGSPIAGIVEALGAGVEKVKVGERVVCGTKIRVHRKAKYGGLQRFTVVDESEIVEARDEVPFTKAVTLASYTPPGALFGATTLNMHRPSIPASPLPDSEQGKKILIWGGSSAMGSISISYAKQAGYTVISTSSRRNFGLLKSLGADHIFDHDDPATVEKVRALFPIDYWHDTLSLFNSLEIIIKILAPEGGTVTKANVLLLDPPGMLGNPTLPEGVTLQMCRFSTHAPENKEWAEWLLSRGGFLEEGIKSGIVKGVPAEVVGGLEKVDEGIAMVNKGVRFIVLCLY